MSFGELEFPEWQAPLEELILEFDREKLPEKLQIVKTAILERFLQLSGQNNGHRERQALNDGLSVLRVIARNRLGFPLGSRIMGINSLEV